MTKKDNQAIPFMTKKDNQAIPFMTKNISIEFSRIQLK